MILNGYKLHKKIYENNQTFVYRATRNIDQKSIILKILKNEYPTIEEISNLEKEYKIFSKLHFKGILQVYALEKLNHKYVIIMEDFSGDSLAKLRKPYFTNLDIKEFLILAIKISDILMQAHSFNMTHRNLNPYNILWNPLTGDVKIIDFSNSSFLSEEYQEYKGSYNLKNLHYISPEQTGKMNRTVDYRTDFYSLGIIFYEILANELPFESEIASEVIYSHIAKTPIFLKQLNDKIPTVIDRKSVV